MIRLFRSSICDILLFAGDFSFGKSTMLSELSDSMSASTGSSSKADDGPSSRLDLLLVSTSLVNVIISTYKTMIRNDNISYQHNFRLHRFGATYNKTRYARTSTIGLPTVG